jgi:positive phototaxis protein PixI
MTTNTTLSRLQQLLPQLFQTVQVSGSPYLRFQLTPETPALVPMEWVQEALLVPASFISPLPNMPAFSIGIMNARDQVFCVIDLAQLLGLSTLPTNPRNYQIVVMSLSAAKNEASDTPPSSPLAAKCLGLAVHQVCGVNRFDNNNLRSIIGNIPDCLKSYLTGCFIEGNQEIVVLDSKAIVQTPLLLKNPFVSDVVKSNFSV